ncbi:MAG TPA: DNA cytosine methyltransferase, partial [Candidatus Binatia bacterium]|nr:DNA cytosine methyltransferase [Candidatus Binatia bacterium]
DDLWPEMRRIVADVAPRHVFAENTERRAINRAADELEEMGYQVRCISISASDLGADHIRQRYWLCAYADNDGKLREPFNAEVEELSSLCCRVWETYPAESRMVDGMAHRMDRLARAGNGQVPAVVRAAWLELTKDLMAQ